MCVCVSLFIASPSSLRVCDVAIQLPSPYSASCCNGRAATAAAMLATTTATSITSSGSNGNNDNKHTRACKCPTSLVHSRAWPPRHARARTKLFVHSRDRDTHNNMFEKCRAQTRHENVRCIVRSRERTTSLVHSRAWPPRHARECTILFVHSRDCNSRNKKTTSSARKLVTRMYGTFCRAFTRPQNATRMPSEDPQGRVNRI